MRTAQLLAGVALAAAAGACAADRDASPRNAPSVSAPSVSAPAASAPAASASGAPTVEATAPTSATPSRTPSLRAREPTVPPPTADGDRRGDLVHGVRTLRGVIERDGEWVILRTDGGRWALLGARALALADGHDVQVRGTPATPPPGCPADRAVTVIR